MLSNLLITLEYFFGNNTKFFSGHFGVDNWCLFSLTKKSLAVLGCPSGGSWCEPEKKEFAPCIVGLTL